MRMISRLLRMFTSSGSRGRTRTPVGVGGGRRRRTTSGGGLGSMLRRFLR